MYIQIEMCSVITSPSSCVQLCCSIANAKPDEKPMPLQEHLSRSISKFNSLTSLSNRPTTLRKNENKSPLRKFWMAAFSRIEIWWADGPFPLGPRARPFQRRLIGVTLHVPGPSRFAVGALGTSATHFCNIISLYKMINIYMSINCI